MTHNKYNIANVTDLSDYRTKRDSTQTLADCVASIKQSYLRIQECMQELRELANNKEKINDKRGHNRAHENCP